MGFHDVQFPTDISYGSAGGPGWKTSVVELSSGVEQRVSRWSSPRRKYDVSYGIRSYSQVSNLSSFYLARQGGAHSFRFKDWFDYTSADPGTVAQSNTDENGVNSSGVPVSYTGSQLDFYLRKSYSSGSETHYRNITLPVANSVLVSAGGSAVPSEKVEIKATPSGTGFYVRILASAGVSGAVKCGFEFDVPVRFGDSADEGISLRMDDFSNASTSIDLIEVLGESVTAAGGFFNYGGATALGTLSSDASLAISGGRTVTFASDADTRKIKLPDSATLPLGGPYFYLINTSGSYKALIYESNGTTSVGEVLLNSEKTVVLGKNSSNATTWYLVP